MIVKCVIAGHRDDELGLNPRSSLAICKVKCSKEDMAKDRHVVAARKFAVYVGMRQDGLTVFDEVNNPDFPYKGMIGWKLAETLEI